MLPLSTPWTGYDEEDAVTQSQRMHTGCAATPDVRKDTQVVHPTQAVREIDDDGVRPARARAQGRYAQSQAQTDPQTNAVDGLSSGRRSDAESA